MDRDGLRSRKASPGRESALTVGPISFVISRVAGDPAGGAVLIAPVSVQLPCKQRISCIFDFREAVLTNKVLRRGDFRLGPAPAARQWEHSKDGSLLHIETAALALARAGMPHQQRPAPQSLQVLAENFLISDDDT